MANLILKSWGEYQVTDDLDRKSWDYECPGCGNRRGHSQLVGFTPAGRYHSRADRSSDCLVYKCTKCQALFWYHSHLQTYYQHRNGIPAQCYPDWPEELIDRTEEGKEQ